MDKLLIAVFALLMATSAQVTGQTDAMQDVLFLRNGDKIKGYILETDSAYVKIVAFGDKLHVVALDDIIHREKQPPGKVLLFNERRFKSEGFQSQFELSSGIGTRGRGYSGLRIINGYKFHGRHFVGLGIGAQRTGDYYGSFYLNGYRSYPYFVRYSADLWQKRSTPYAFVDVGSQWQNTNNAKTLSPAYFRVGIGDKLITKRALLYGAMSYSYNRMRSYYRFAGSEGLTDWYRNHSVEISLGIQFN